MKHFFLIYLFIFLNFSAVKHFLMAPRDYHSETGWELPEFPTLGSFLD